MTTSRNTVRCTLSAVAVASSLLVLSIPADARTGAAPAGFKHGQSSRPVTVGLQVPVMHSNGYGPIPFLILGVGY